MLFKIKDIPIGETIGSYQFLEGMRKNPELEYDSFSSLEEIWGEDWKGWWVQNKKHPNYVYHISWLEEYKNEI